MSCALRGREVRRHHVYCSQLCKAPIHNTTRVISGLPTVHSTTKTTTINEQDKVICSGVLCLHNNNCIRTPNDAATYGTPHAASLPTGHAPHASDDGSYGDDGYDYVSAEHDGDDDADAAAAGSRPRTVSLIHVTARIG